MMVIGDFVVLLDDGQERKTVSWKGFRASNPYGFTDADELRLLQGATIVWGPLRIRMTTDDLCILCGVPIGRQATKCHACQHRDEGQGYPGVLGRSPTRP